MDIEMELQQLSNKYNLKFLKQEFENCFNENWLVETYSIYNDTGCFTIHYLVQRMELDFYISDKIYSEREKLCQKSINVYEYEKEIWKANSKVGFFKDLFFYYKPKKIIKTLIKVMDSLAKNGKKIFNINI